MIATVSPFFRTLGLTGSIATNEEDEEEEGELMSFSFLKRPN